MSSERRPAGPSGGVSAGPSGERSAGAILVDALRDAGVTHLFANFGSDHPAIIEALARDAAALGTERQV